MLYSSWIIPLLLLHLSLVFQGKYDFGVNAVDNVIERHSRNVQVTFNGVKKSLLLVEGMSLSEFQVLLSNAYGIEKDKVAIGFRTEGSTIIPLSAACLKPSILPNQEVQLIVAESSLLSSQTSTSGTPSSNSPASSVSTSSSDARQNRIALKQEKIQKAKQNHPHYIHHMELQQWGKAVDVMRSRDIGLQVFYHTSTWQQNWRRIIEEQLLLLEGKRTQHFIDANSPNGGPPNNHTNKFSHRFGLGVKEMIQMTSQLTGSNWDQTGGGAGLVWNKNTWASVLKEAEGLSVTVAGKNADDIKPIKETIEALTLSFKDKISIHFNRTADRGSWVHGNEKTRKELWKDPTLSEGECATFDRMHDFCSKRKEMGKRTFVLYFHSKGGCCVRDLNSAKNPRPVPVASWREGMNTFNIEFPSICLRALLNGHVACGMEYQDAHFSGNFFWADCDHVASLPKLWNRFDPWSAEFFIFNVSKHGHLNMRFGENCGYSTYNCIGVDHYQHECPRERYRAKLNQYVSSFQLPPNTKSTVNSSFEWVSKHCGALTKIPYVKREFFNDAGKFPF